MMVERPCLIAAVDLNDRAEGVIRRASKLASLCDSDLMVVHAVEYDAGFESDHVPFMTPAVLRAAMARDARGWLLNLLDHLGIADAQVIVRAGKPAEVLAQLAAEKRVRYIVTGRLKWGALSKLAALGRDPRVVESRCDVLSVGGARSFGRTVAGFIGGLLLGRERGGR